MLFCVALFVGCANSEAEPRIKDPNSEPTQISYNLTSIESKNGNRTYRMQTPLMERYELADEPFTEFTKGIKVETFNDTTFVVESDLIADYAHYYENKQVWEARGNVVAHNYSGDKTLYTEQLFWNEKEDKIYSDKMVRVKDGRDSHIGTGFESDGGFNRYTFRNSRGIKEFKQDTTSSVDTISVDSGAKVVDSTQNRSIVDDSFAPQPQPIPAPKPATKEQVKASTLSGDVKPVD